jgi:anti-sigma B factor antagonist
MPSSSDPFVITHEQLAPATSLLQPRGELDVLTAPQLKEAIATTLEDGNRFLAVDLRQVSFIDSTTLGVLIGALKRVNAEEGRLVLLCHDPAILKLIQITGLHRIFELRANQEDGLEYLQSGNSNISS